MEPVATGPYAELASRLDAAQARALAIASELHAAARRRRPTRDAWCVDEILDHLAITVESYRDRTEAAFAKARAKGARKTPTLRHTGLGSWLMKMLRPGSKPVPSPGKFRPRESPAGESAAHDAVGRFRDSHALLRRWLAEAPAVETSAVKVSSPAFFLFRLNLDDVLVTLVMHLERHTAQIDRTAQAVKVH